MGVNMSVIVKIIGSDNGGDEYRAAVKLKHILEDGIPAKAVGEITLHPNASLAGQGARDIDLMMIGTVSNYKLPMIVTGREGNMEQKEVTISSFCTAIEIKSHDISGIKRNMTELLVKYREGWHSVTAQSMHQKQSVRRFFSASLNLSPFISNVIWFIGLTAGDLNTLLSTGTGKIECAALPATFTVKALMQAIIDSSELCYYRGTCSLDALANTCSPDILSRQFERLTIAKQNMGTLTRKRIEQITTKEISSNIIIPNGKSMPIYSGRAGTGKTVGLIQTAIRLVEESDARVLILTYNRLLVSDLRRLFSMADLPDMFEPACVHVQTMHSYFFYLIAAAFYNGKMDGKVFLNNYEEELNKLSELLEDDPTPRETLYDLLGHDPALLWDYCAIDEGQDWSNAEQRLILSLFGQNHIIVADGGLQFVRQAKRCSWKLVPSHKTNRLQYCLRQRHNLVMFLNRFNAEFNYSQQEIRDSDKLPGGKVVCCIGIQNYLEIIQEELNLLRHAGNMPYDMMIMVPASMVSKPERHFKGTSEFIRHNIKVWDATQEDYRSDYPIESDAVRVMQYDSARGLECWTACCLSFDKFIEEKKGIFRMDESESSILLESEAESLKRHLFNWMMIPLTRAIDTIILHIEHPDSKIATTMRNIAEKCPDYVILKEDTNVS